MARMLVAVVSAAELAKHQMNIATAAQRLACESVLCCVFDSAAVAQRTLPKSWSILSAATLFDEEYHRVAFGFLPEEFRQYCTVLLVQKYLPKAQELALFDPRYQVKMAQSMQLQPDSISGLPPQQNPLTMPSLRPQELAFLQPGLQLWCDGVHTQAFLRWCGDIMRSLSTLPTAALAASLPGQSGEAREFLHHYLNYAPFFDCGIGKLGEDMVHLQQPSAAAEPCHLDTFADGSPVPEALRLYYAKGNGWLQRLENPFASPEAFFAQAADPADSGAVIVPPMLQAICGVQPAVTQLMENADLEDRLALVRWYLNCAAAEYGVTDAWLAPVAQSLAAYEASLIVSKPSFGSRMRGLFGKE